MGNVPSVPTTHDRETRTLRVIGGGYIRTGTMSLSQACATLLNGPAWHGGSQVLGREDSYNRLINECYVHRYNKPVLHKLLREITRGFVATTDMPMSQFAPDLLEIYPDAIVVCTTRDPKKWWVSAEPIGANAESSFLDVLLAPCPGWRWFPTLLRNAKEKEADNQGVKYGKKEMWPRQDSIVAHEEFLRRTVPKEKLLFMEVKQGWGPLCEKLGMEVPNVPFPRANDAEAAEGVFRDIVLKAGSVWLGILGVAGVVGYYGVSHML